jgi:hypothetical protein
VCLFGLLVYQMSHVSGRETGKEETHPTTCVYGLMLLESCDAVSVR